MIHHWYATDARAEATELEKTIQDAVSPPKISSACAAVEAFLRKHTQDQARWFFSITFQTLLCNLFGFNFGESASTADVPTPMGWIDTATLSRDSQLSDKIFSLLSPDGVLLSSISAADRHCLIRYFFPNERLPEWVRLVLLNERDRWAFVDLCPLLKNRVKEDPTNGSSFLVQLNVFEYYIFWFAYYPVYRGGGEGSGAMKAQRRNKKSRLEKWTGSIPGLSSSKSGSVQKKESNLYMRLLYAYLRMFVPIFESVAHQPYQSSLLHYSHEYGTSVNERAEFLVNVLIQFWLVDNDFSPLPLGLCKSYDVSSHFLTALGEAPPTSGLGDVINLFVKYLTLSSVVLVGGYDKVESAGNYHKVPGSIVVKTRAALHLQSTDSWASWIRRPLYRFILRTFLFCPVETSLKNVAQVFDLWVSYMEPWKLSLEEFTELDATISTPFGDSLKKDSQTSSHTYSSSWQWFVLANYLYYSSLVMHFTGFAHKFLHTDPELIVRMVSKVISILTSSTELLNLIKDVDTVFHSKPTGSSKSLLNALYGIVPTIREELQDWENGLCERDADGSFLRNNWNKDLRLFSETEDSGQQLLQLFVLRAEFELQALSGDNLAQSLQCLDSLKAQLGKLYGITILKSSPSMMEQRKSQQLRNEKFCPSTIGNQKVANIKYRGDWMKRPISSDEIAWLARLLIHLSDWLNEKLGLNQADNSHAITSRSSIEVSGPTSGDVGGASDPMKMVFYSVLSWLIALAGLGLNFMRKHGMRVNLRILASKKVVTLLFILVAFNMLKRAFA